MTATHGRSDQARIDHVAIRVSDLARSVDFYEKAFGGRSVQSHAEDEAIGRVHLVELGDGFCVELFQRGRGQASRGAGDVGVTHFSISLPDVDGAYRKALAAGALSVMAPVDASLPLHPQVVVRVAFVEGPQGELIEFINSDWADGLLADGGPTEDAAARS